MLLSVDSQVYAMEYLTTLDLLILDDIAIIPPSATAREILYEIVNTRYILGRPTIVTNNLPLGKAVKAGYLDAQVASRLSENAVYIHLDGEDWRPFLRGVGNPDPDWDLGYDNSLWDKDEEDDEHEEDDEEDGEQWWSADL